MTKAAKKTGKKRDSNPRRILANYYIPASAHALLKRLAKRAERSTRAHASLLLEEAIERSGAEERERTSGE